MTRSITRLGSTWALAVAFTVPAPGEWSLEASARLNQFQTPTVVETSPLIACFDVAEAEVIFDDLTLNRSAGGHASPTTAWAFTHARREPTGGNPGGISFSNALFRDIELSITNDDALQALIPEGATTIDLKVRFLVEWQALVVFTHTGIFVTGNSGGSFQAGVSKGAGYTNVAGGVSIVLDINGNVTVNTSGALLNESNVGSKVIEVDVTVDIVEGENVSLWLRGDIGTSAFSALCETRTDISVTPLPIATLATADGTPLELLDVSYGFVEVGLRGCDDDGDGLLNGWETDGYDYDDDGVVDIDFPALGADPLRADLFVEVDAMSGLAPDPDALSDVVDAFANAPRLNPDGTTGITLHAMLDDTNLPVDQWDAFSFPEFMLLKLTWFGTSDERASSNWEAIRAAKRRTHRYCIFGDTRGTNGSSGLSELWGNDFMVTLGGWSVPTCLTSLRETQAGTFMHELGHTLGLTHGGRLLGVNFKPNYFSVMNYLWQFPNCDLLDGSGNLVWQLDYSRERLGPLKESNLDETAGIGPSSFAYPVTGVAYPQGGGTNCRVILPLFTGGAIDWDGDGVIESSVSQDLNRGPQSSPNCGSGPLIRLDGFEDWSAIRLNFRGSPFFWLIGGVETTFGEDEDELTLDDVLLLEEIVVDAWHPNDIDGDGIVGFNDLLLLLAVWGEDVAYADVDGDGVVGFNDLLAVLGAWGDV